MYSLRWPHRSEYCTSTVMLYWVTSTLPQLSIEAGNDMRADTTPTEHITPHLLLHIGHRPRLGINKVTYVAPSGSRGALHSTLSERVTYLTTVNDLWKMTVNFASALLDDRRSSQTCAPVWPKSLYHVKE